jgi:two-component system response regulator GlrR
MKALVVDDDPLILECCRRVLEAQGFGLAAASSVDEALAHLRDGRFDLLLTDAKMPGKDGLALVEMVRARWPGVRVLVMSGYPTAETVTSSRIAGAGVFLCKPFAPDELLDAVRRVSPGGIP